jgi:hypothetical protein
MRDMAAAHDTQAAELAVARAKASEDLALIAHQKLRIAKLERQIYGSKSERSSLLIEQMALQFEELEASATEDELAAEIAVARVTSVAGFTRQRPERNTFLEHLPRERVVIPPPASCACCGGTRLRKMGEDVTKSLESILRQWKVIETVREKFTCRDCKTISQSPAPFHVIPRGWAGLNRYQAAAARGPCQLRPSARYTQSRPVLVRPRPGLSSGTGVSSVWITGAVLTCAPIIVASGASHQAV